MKMNHRHFDMNHFVINLPTKTTVDVLTKETTTQGSNLCDPGSIQRGETMSQNKEKEVMAKAKNIDQHHSVNIMSSISTRRNQVFDNANMSNDIVEPFLSQESIKISWRWDENKENIQPTNCVANNSKKLKQIMSDDDKPASPLFGTLSEVWPKKQRSPPNPFHMFKTPPSSPPKGLYKFLDEMKKIQFDTESITSCVDDKTMTV